jgi:hypothetical protein
MLYRFTSQNHLEPLSPLQDLEIKETDNALLLSILGKISLGEATRRLANDHKAYVAWYRNIPVAFGWMAMGKAFIGELNHTIILPLGHRYLWNFRTDEQFRGMGIYSRILQYIIGTESVHSECFWILHAPENESSEKGIIKAGFQFAGQVSVRNINEVIFGKADSDIQNYLLDVEQTLGFKNSSDTQATCWKCSSPYLAHKKTECCCTSKDNVCNQQLFISVVSN